MVETIGLFLVESFVAVSGTGEALVAFAEGSYLGISGATVIGATALLAATIGLQYAIGQPSGSDLPSGSNGSQALRQPIPPRLYAYGRCRVGGYYMLYEVRNGQFVGVVALVDGQICRFLQFYLHDDIAVVQTDGRVTGAVDATDGRYVAPSYLNAVIRFSSRIGLPVETAHDMIMTLGGASDLWTSAHRGDGIASFAVICTAPSTADFSKAFPQQLPQFSAVADWFPAYDPRDPAQVRGDVATQAPCYNPVLQAIDFFTNAGHGGLGFDWDTCIAPVLDDLMIEASVCDEQVLRADSLTEARYQSSGWWTSQNDPAATLDAIATACDGWYTFNGDGTLTFIVGKYRQPSVIIDQAHIYGFSVNSGVEDENAVNALTWSFTDPNNEYRDTPGMAWRDDTLILERGIERSQSVTLSWVQSHSQGRRLIKRKFQQLNPLLNGTLTTDFYGIKALRERWIRIQDDRHPDLVDIVVEITKGPVMDLLSQKLTFTWRSINPNEIDAWDSATEEGSQPSRGDDNPTDTLPVPDGLSGSYGSGEITVEFSDLQRPDLTYVMQWRIGAGAWVSIDVGAGTSDGTTTTVVGTGFSSGHSYEIQIASSSYSALGGWSASLFVTS